MRAGVCRTRHVSGSWLMSVSLVSLRMARIRSREPACRIRSSCTWEATGTHACASARTLPSGLGFQATGPLRAICSPGAAV